MQTRWPRQFGNKNEKSRCRSIVTIAANLGMIAGIAFLALELSQNNRLLQAEAIGALLDARIARSGEMALDEDLAELIRKNMRGEALTDVELLRLSQFQYRTFLGFQKTYFLFQEGVISERYLRTNLPLMKIAFSDGVGTRTPFDAWQEFESVAPPDYIDFVNQCVLAECVSIPR